MPDEIDQKRIVEAALFMSQNAMSIEDLVKATGIASPGFVRNALEELIKEYAEKGTSLEIVKIADKYVFSLKEPYAAKVSGLAVGPDLSRGALRILAYISKNDGMVQSELVKLFGSTTYEYMSELSGKEFVETKKSGRTKKIFVTNKFREYFNI